VNIKTYFGNIFRRNTLTKYPGLFRPQSGIFLTGDSLRKNSDHIFDETQSVDPLKVRKNDKVFLRTDLKNLYFQSIHKKIKEPYILISHNSDISVEDQDLENVDEKILHWFTTCLNTNELKQVTPIPIGFENRRFMTNGRLKNLKKFDKLFNKKNNYILASFNQHTNYLLRKKLLNQLKDNSEIKIVKYNNHLAYMDSLKDFKYSVCPEGNGLDTHRIWESILVNTIPIVSRSILTTEFSEMGAPILIVNNLNELANLTINDLDSLIIEQNIIFNKSFIYLKHWLNVINSKKI